MSEKSFFDILTEALELHFSEDEIQKVSGWAYDKWARKEMILFPVKQLIAEDIKKTLIMQLPKRVKERENKLGVVDDISTEVSIFILGVLYGYQKGQGSLRFKD